MSWPTVTLPLLRQPNATLDLVTWADAMIGAAFAWGSVDCLQLAMQALAIESGREVLELLDGTDPYADALGAATVLQVTGGFLAGLAALGLIEVPTSEYAQTGDLVIEPGSPFDSASIVFDDRVLSIAEDGVVVWDVLPSSDNGARFLRIP